MAERKSGEEPGRLVAALVEHAGGWLEAARLLVALWREAEPGGAFALGPPAEAAEKLPVKVKAGKAGEAPDARPVAVLEWGPYRRELGPFDARALAVDLLCTAESAETLTFLHNYFAAAKDKEMGRKILEHLLPRLVSAHNDAARAYVEARTGPAAGGLPG